MYFFHRQPNIIEVKKNIEETTIMSYIIILYFQKIDWSIIARYVYNYIARFVSSYRSLLIESRGHPAGRNMAAYHTCRHVACQSSLPCTAPIHANSHWASADRGAVSAFCALRLQVRHVSPAYWPLEARAGRVDTNCIANAASYTRPCRCAVGLTSLDRLDRRLINVTAVYQLYTQQLSGAGRLIG